jgi:capsular exopolysaccharide synthesis family protein
VNSFDLRTVYYEVRRFCWILAVTVLIGAGLGYLYFRHIPPSFTSEAKMMLAGKITIDAGTSYVDQMEDFMGTQAAIMQGREVRLRAEKLLLAVGKRPAGQVVISASYVPRTAIFLLRAKGEDPAYTQAFLAATMREFMQLRKEIRWQRAEEATSALKEEAARVQHEVDAAAQALTDFQAKFNASSLEDQLSAETAYIGNLRKRLADLRVQRSVVAPYRLAPIDREMNALNREISQAEAQLAGLNNNLAEYRNLKTRLDTSRTTYEKLSANLQSVDVGKQLDQEVITPLEPASLAIIEKDKLAVDVGLGAACGLALGAGVIYLLARSVPRFQSITAVKRALGLPIFGRILRDSWITRKRTVLDGHRGHLAFAESFRNLRSSLLNLPGEFEARTCIAVTSAVPREGKSTVAVNLAIALAATEARTLLIDADLRRGALHQLLKVESGPGLSDLITAQCLLDQVLRPTVMPNLTLLPSGQRIANVADRMASYRIERLFEILARRFDYVILDTPPVLAADDALTVAAKADWTLFVVRLRYSRPTQSQRAIEELTSRQVEVAGVVVNCVPKALTSQSYYYAQPLEKRPFSKLPAKENRPPQIDFNRSLEHRSK